MTEIDAAPQPQNDPDTSVRVLTVTTMNNRPPRRVKRAALRINNATLGTAAMVYANLGGVSIPVWIPTGTGLTADVLLYAGEGGQEFLELSEFTLSATLATGSIVLMTVS